VVQVAAPVALTAFAGQSELALPLIWNVTVPVGTAGVRETPASCAVKVTDVLTAWGLAGEAVTPSVAASEETDMLKVAVPVRLLASLTVTV
jgi:hypothetical protein